MIHLSDMIHEYSELELHYKLPIALGVGLKFKSYFADLTVLKHIITTGITGSGKSVFANDIIAFIMAYVPPTKVNFLLFDFKQVEFSIYSDSPYARSPIITNPKEAFEVLERLITEKNERLTSGKPIDEYPYIVVMIDTFSDWIYFDREKFESNFIELMKDACQAKIHVVMCDSRMSPNTFTPRILALFPTKIAFQGIDYKSSFDFFGYGDSSTLVGCGDMLYLEENKYPIRIQAPMIYDSEIKEMIATSTT